MKGLFNLNNKFGQLLNKFGQCILLSIYWILFSLPIFTWGAAACALYSTGRKMLMDNEGRLFRSFKEAFKENFKQGTIVGIAVLLFCLVVIYCALLMVGLGLLKDTIGTIVGIIYLLVVIAVLVYAHYVISYIARFEDPLKTVLRNCVYISLVHFDTSLRLGIQLAVIGAVFYFLNIMPYLPAIVMLLPSAYSLLTVDPLEKVFKQYMPKEESEGEPTDE